MPRKLENISRPYYYYLALELVIPINQAEKYFDD